MGPGVPGGEQFRCQIVEALSRQFKAVFSDPEEADLNTGHDITVSESITSGDNDVDFTVKDILDAIKEMKPEAAPGPDGIPAILLKSSAEALAHPLYLMWIRSLAEVLVPSSCKVSLVTPSTRRVAGPQLQIIALSL